MNNIGTKIYELRLKNNLSQDILAEKLGVSRQAISKWENSQSVPELEKIVLMSEIFNVSTDYLLKDSQPDTNETTEETPEADSGFTNKKLQQTIGLTLIGAGIASVLLGFIFTSRTIFQIAPLFVLFGFMLVYIKKNAYLWCLGTLIVLTLLFGKLMLLPFVYYMLLFAEIIAFAAISLSR